MNVRLDLTLLPEIKNCNLSSIHNFGCFREVPIDRHTHSCNIFQQKVIGFNVRNFSRCKSKNNNAAAERKRQAEEEEERKRQEGAKQLLALFAWAAQGAERLDRAAISRLFTLVFGEEIDDEEWQGMCEELGADASEGLDLAHLQALDAGGGIASWAAAHPSDAEYDALLAAAKG